MTPRLVTFLPTDRCLPSFDGLARHVDNSRSVDYPGRVTTDGGDRWNAVNRERFFTYSIPSEDMTFREDDTEDMTFREDDTERCIPSLDSPSDRRNFRKAFLNRFRHVAFASTDEVWTERETATPEW